MQCQSYILIRDTAYFGGSPSSGITWKHTEIFLDHTV